MSIDLDVFNDKDERAVTLTGAIPVLMEFRKNGEIGQFDVVDGRFDYTGSLPVSDAARELFEYFASHCGQWWIERASAKTAEGG